MIPFYIKDFYSSLTTLLFNMQFRIWSPCWKHQGAVGEVCEGPYQCRKSKSEQLWQPFPHPSFNIWPNFNQVGKDNMLKPWNITFSWRIWICNGWATCLGHPTLEIYILNFINGACLLEICQRCLGEIKSLTLSWLPYFPTLNSSCFHFDPQLNLNLSN